MYYYYSYIYTRIPYHERPTGFLYREIVFTELYMYSTNILCTLTLSRKLVRFIINVLWFVLLYYYYYYYYTAKSVSAPSKSGFNSLVPYRRLLDKTENSNSEFNQSLFDQSDDEFLLKKKLHLIKIAPFFAIKR